MSSSAIQHLEQQSGRSLDRLISGWLHGHPSIQQRAWALQALGLRAHRDRPRDWKHFQPRT